MKTLSTFPILMMISTVLSAQAPEKKVIVQTTGGSMISMAAADINNDDATDFLVLTDHDELAWYETDGGATFTNRHVINSDIESITDIMITDINNDGLDDIFYFTNTYSFYTGWLENPGTDMPWPNHLIDEEMLHFIGLFDTDSDGDADLVYEDADGTLSWKERVGDDFTTEYPMPDLVSSIMSSTVADVDLDGDMDWAAYFYDCCTKYYENNGDGTFTTTTINTDEYSNGVTSGDVNNDGYTDLVVHIGSVLYTSTYDPVSDTFNTETLWGYYYDEMDFTQLDIDVDGDDDWIIFTNYGIAGGFAELQWIENTGAAFDIDERVTLADSLQSDSPFFELFDYNADNRMDLFSLDEEDLEIRLNEPGNNFAEAFIPDIAYIRMDLMNVFDIDGDSDNDIMVISHDGKAAWFKYDIATDSFYAVHYLPNMEASPYPTTLNHFDFDADGDIDVIASFRSAFGAAEVSYYFLNDGAGDFTEYEFSESAFNKVWFTDADADGDNDMVVWNYTSPHHLSLYSNTGETANLFSFTANLTTSGYWKMFEMMDIDNDGDDDFVGSKSGYDELQQIINIDGAGTFNPPVYLFTGTCESPSFIYGVDADADGDDDLVYVCPDDGDTYLVTNAAGVYDSETPIGSFFDDDMDNPSYPYASDLNGDNMEELIFARYASPEGTDIKFSSVEGTYMTDYQNFSQDFGMFANIDGDDKMDFVATNDFEFYVEYDVIIIAPTYTIYPPATAWLAENGAVDQLGIALTSIPQTTLTVDITPGVWMDAGAGEGVAVTITFLPDSSALLPQYISYVVPDDAIVEDVVTQTIHISSNATWGVYSASLNENYTYTITDNDLGLFITPGLLPTLNEGGTTTINAHVNVVPSSPVTLYLDPDAEVTLGAGGGEVIAIVLPATLEAIEEQVVTITILNDYIYEPAYTTSIEFDMTGDDPLFDEFTTEPLLINVIDNDDVNIIKSTSTFYITEGIETFDITFDLASSPLADVTIIADPDTELDLGAGAGNAVSITFFADGVLPDALIISGIAVEDMLAEGSHDGMIDISIVTDDPYYAVEPMSDIIMHIEDNEDLQGVSVVCGTGGEFLEGYTGIEISISLFTQPIDNVFIYATPDMQLDLGEGPGMPLPEIYTTADDITEPKMVYVNIYEDVVFEGDHTGVLQFLVSSDDPFFEGYSIEPIAFSIVDNDEATSIENENEVLSVYPSVNNGVFTVATSSTDIADKLMIVNTIGQQVYTCAIQPNQVQTIDVAHLPDGIYVVMIYHAETGFISREIEIVK